jgi:hypothetical protein
LDRSALLCDIVGANRDQPAIANL